MRKLAEPIRVWDLGVRAFHWGLVAAVIGAGVTGFILGATTLFWHLIAGEAVVAALAWRAIWGGLGPTYARFAGFAYRPAAVVAHLDDLRRGGRPRHLGHNPLGAMMVFALLAVLSAIALAGVASLGGMLKQGPLRAFLSYAVGAQALEIHYWLAILLLVMIVFHLGGVAFESWHGRENLVLAMATGDKPACPPAAAVRPATAAPRAAIAVLLATATVCVSAVLALSALPRRGAPPTALDPVFAEQCGACHLAFPPVLAPASTWNGILADLQHHFGADATLAPDQVAQIRGWVDANAAERWDTLPAHMLRDAAANGSLRITDASGWRTRHRGIADAVFTAAPVYRRGNCAACHADAASGDFAPQNIAIPAGGTPATTP